MSKRFFELWFMKKGESELGVFGMKVYEFGDYVMLNDSLVESVRDLI